MLAEIAGMSLWFMSAAILPDMLAETPISEFRQAALSSAVQAGFVVGALLSAVFGLADRIDPRRFFAACALSAALVNASLLVLEPGSSLSIFARFITGMLLAGVYPVGLKIAVGWGQKDRGFLVGTLVGALTFGSAAPHLLAFLGGADWRWAVSTASIAAGVGGLLCLFSGLGPFHGKASRFDIRTISEAWTNRKVRLAYAGYLGHMWELYAMWAWIGVAATASFTHSLPEQQAIDMGRLTAFGTIAAGGIACILAGFIADRLGKANIAIWAMMISGSAALASAAAFGGPAWLTIVLALIWGAAILPDSAQFSALVADYSAPEKAGSLMTFQTALGFALTFLTVQATPLLALSLGWPVLFAIMAIGPALGVVAMQRLKSIT
ncbi:sugar phosphate permease [Roseibium hamelinense]|uniref:Sugar phosphate permease n=1 Tax=Roseibium hamelinense TaxID=150831 RepID=A0A562T2U6_9HYPH|nr:MFS transporter [Roseibium hamelinense]MTI44542.1 MFS transporter [Roseibium hamelinense]TWI87166.1 sugar phosphate permease [Roseibium hamelinense]